MTKRSIISVILLTFITFGIYSIYWFVKTKGELNARGAQIPTAWLIIVPFVNFWWMWKYYEAAEQVTNSGVNALLNFLLGLFVTSLIPMALCQSEYNNMNFADASHSATGESAPLDSAQTENIEPTAPSNYTPLT